MLCKICGDTHCEVIEGSNSLVAYGTYEDINGHFHNHDENYRRQKWKCSEGHTFNCKAYFRCWCGWTSQYPEKNFVEMKRRPQDEIPRVSFPEP